MTSHLRVKIRNAFVRNLVPITINPLTIVIPEWGGASSPAALVALIVNMEVLEHVVGAKQT